MGQQLYKITQNHHVPSLCSIFTLLLPEFPANVGLVDLLAGDGAGAVAMNGVVSLDPMSGERCNCSG